MSSSRPLSDTFQTPRKDLSYTFQTSSGCLPDTFQSPFRQLPNDSRTFNDKFPTCPMIIIKTDLGVFCRQLKCQNVANTYQAFTETKTLPMPHLYQYQYQSFVQIDRKSQHRHALSHCSIVLAHLKQISSQMFNKSLNFCL